MGLINCPECGAKISDTVKQCVHCGYKFIVCSECGDINNAELQYCKNCGYEVCLRSLDNKESCKEKYDKLIQNNNYVVAWENSTPFVKMIKQSFKYIKITLLMLAAILFVIAIVKFINWNNIQDVLEQSASAKEFLNNSKALIIISCVFIGFVASGRFMIEAYRTYSLHNWLTLNNLDPEIGLKYYNENMSYTELLSCDELIGAGYMKINPTVKTTYYFSILFAIVACFFTILCLGICVFQNLEVYVQIEVGQNILGSMGGGSV